MTREEAINEIKTWDFLNEKESEAVRTLIPELRESDDERMMKNIRLAILSVEDVFWRTHGLTAKEAISYLEKQKEQKPISQEDFDTAKREALWGERNPAELIPDRRQIAFMIEDGRRCGVIEGRKEVIDNPEMYGLQKPAAFGGKDKRIVDALILELKTNPSVATTNGYKRADYIDWLSNLCPSWKPSEEQMKGLKFFLDLHRQQRNAGATSWREYDALESLCADLNKLLYESTSDNLPHTASR